MTCNTLYSDGTGISGHSPTPRRESIESLAKHIRLLVLDVDGVMTDGGLYYDANGLVMKRFHVLDGIGIRLAKTAGIEVAVLSGMDVPCVVRRLEVLGVTEYHGGADNKCTILDGMRKRMSLEWQEIAYLGDDLGRSRTNVSRGAARCRRECHAGRQKTGEVRDAKRRRMRRRPGICRLAADLPRETGSSA